MAWRIVRQPNGKLARFSDVVDDFTHLDMSKEEAICLCNEHMSPQESVDKVQSGLDDIKPWSTTDKGDGIDRWNDCLESISIVHGKEKVTELSKKYT